MFLGWDTASLSTLLSPLYTTSIDSVYNDILEFIGVERTRIKALLELDLLLHFCPITDMYTYYTH